jgi:DNA-binding transcriptional ArsR family regulator
LNQQQLQVGRKPLAERTKRPAEAAAYSVNHWARLEVLTVLHQGEFSAGEVAEILKEDIRYITGHIRDLYEAGCIEFVGYRVIGSRSRPIYRAVTLPEITDEVWRSMPSDERHDASGAIVQGFLAESLSSHRNHKMDDDEDLCLIWDAPPLDAEGRRKLRERFTEVWEKEVLAIHGESANRCAESGEEAIPTVVGLHSFIRGRSGKPNKGYYRAGKR